MVDLQTRLRKGVYPCIWQLRLGAILLQKSGLLRVRHRGQQARTVPHLGMNMSPSLVSLRTLASY